MKSSRVLLLVVAAALVCAGPASAKSLLEKSIYFVNPQSGKIDSTKYWKIYIGKYPSITLVRKFPGEDSLPVNADINLTVLSSGYIEGYGYTRKGRVDCMASFMIDTGTGAIKLPVDSIEYLFAGGTMAKPRGMKVCSVNIDVEGNNVQGVREMLLTKYKLVVDADERNLKPLGDANVELFGFSKAAFMAAEKAQKEAPAAPANPAAKPDK
ncbi:MAG TPA: hypothetical protein VKF42_01520 [Chitinivibrionales bacterium]|nr:hypothetical protein [Chitinivibrionales bacterium]